MKAIIAHGAGGPEVLSYDEVETPTPGLGEVLVRTVAAGVNRADLLQRQGHYPPPKGTSDVIGLEVAGHVAAVAEDVFHVTVGDPVVGLLAGGGYAEYVVVPEGQLMVPPPGVDLATAAGLVEVAAAVVSNVGDLLDDSKVFLVHGGTGGIGTFAIQYAKAKGATVAATCGNREKMAVARSLGADIVLDYHDDWVAGLRAATGDKRGADIILDVMGAKYLDANVHALTVDGKLVIIGLQGGRTGELDLSLLLNKRATVTATSLRFRSRKQKAAICRRLEREVWPLVEDGSIRPAAETRFPLADAGRAHEHLESGANVGKIILLA